VLFGAQNLILVATFILLILYLWKDSVSVDSLLSITSFLNVIAMWMVTMFIAQKLVFLAKPPDTYTCAASGDQINPLVRLKVEKEMLRFISSTFS
jgi:hypothetical protein